VHDLDRRPVRPQVRADLHGAPGVGRRDDRGARRFDGRRLPATERARHRGLRGRVDPGRAAAPIPVADLDELELGDHREQRSRRIVDVLGAQGMARVVVSDADRQRMQPRLPETVLGEEGHQIDDRQARARQQLLVGLHVCAAAGGIDHDDVGVGERMPGPAGEPPRDRESAVVGGEGAAARLPAGHRHAPSRAREHADRREVHVMEPPVLHAAREQCHCAAHLQPRRIGRPRQRGERRGALGHHRADARRQDRAEQRLQGRREPDQRRVRQQPMETEPMHEA
jgi:hypothetical protein